MSDDEHPLDQGWRSARPTFTWAWWPTFAMNFLAVVFCTYETWDYSVGRFWGHVFRWNWRASE